MIRRIFDLFAAVLLLACLSLILFVLAIIIKLTSRGPALYWSNRVGKNNKVFRMCKFRTMRVSAPAVATHLFKDSDKYLTLVGYFLRKFSLDELPQLFNIISGDMTFVGPRPALFNQNDLIELRTSRNIHRLVPGITGWAQVNGRDEISIPTKVDFDEYYLKNKNFLLDVKILFITMLKVINREGVKH